MRCRDALLRPIFLDDQHPAPCIGTQLIQQPHLTSSLRKKFQSQRLLSLQVL